MRWLQAQVKRTRLATRQRETSINPERQANTDWTPIRVPGYEKGPRPETQFAWFAYNQLTKESFEFGSFEEAAFCLHPDNERQPKVYRPKAGDRIRLINMPNDPHPIDAGQLGTVTGVRP